MAGVSATVLALIIAFAICYPITRLPVSRRVRSFVLNWSLSLRFLPPIAVVIPYFTIVRALGLYNQLPALIIVYTIFNLPLSIWMLKGFLEEIPLELEEAALVDGASRLQRLPAGAPAADAHRHARGGRRRLRLRLGGVPVRLHPDRDPSR